MLYRTMISYPTFVCFSSAICKTLYMHPAKNGAPTAYVFVIVPVIWNSLSYNSLFRFSNTCRNPPLQSVGIGVAWGCACDCAFRGLANTA